MRELVERVVEGDVAQAAAAAATAGAGRAGAAGPASRPGGRSGRRVTVNVGESPLGWLRSRGLVSARQFEAGERLRGDYEAAMLAPRVTMRWTPRVDGGGGEGIDLAGPQLSAKRRFDAAVAAAGPGLADVLWRVVCAGEAMPEAEKALGWPVRAGRVVLTLALDRVAAHYRLA